jgi:hypothetical protein
MASQRPTFMLPFDGLYDECREMAEDQLLPNVNFGLLVSTALTTRLALMLREIRMKTNVRLQFLADTEGKRGKREITKLVNHTIDGIRNKRNQDIVQAHQNQIISTLEMLSLEDEGWPPLSAPTVDNAPTREEIETRIERDGGLASFTQPWLRKIQIVKDRERRAEQDKLTQAQRIIDLQRARTRGDIKGETDDEILANLKEVEIAERQRREQADRERHWRDYWLADSRAAELLARPPATRYIGGEDDGGEEADGEGYGYGGEGPSRRRRERSEGDDGIADETDELVVPPTPGGVAVVEGGVWIVLTPHRAEEARRLLRGE